MSANSPNLVFNLGRDPNHPRCPVTDRLLEVGAGSLPHAQQTANFIRERDLDADRPREGEVCPQTGRAYEVGSGCHTRAAQTAHFIAELPQAQKDARLRAAEALLGLPVAGQA